MNWKLDSEKLTVILRRANVILLILAIAAGIYCGGTAIYLLTLPDRAELNSQVQARQTRIPELEDGITAQREAVTQAEAASGALLMEATQTLDGAKGEYDAAETLKTDLQSQIDGYQNAAAQAEQLKLDIAEIRTEYGQAIRKLEDKILAGESDYKICYLTFDDGPSYHTDKFLDKLDEHDAYATFFTIGCQLSEAQHHRRDACLRREALSGHSICNHTYTHAIHSGVYASPEAFLDAVKQQDDLVYSVTGMHTDIVRFPAGSYYCPHRDEVIPRLAELGYGWIDWSGNAFDSGTKVNTSEFTAKNVIWQVRQEPICVMLMHDWRLETLGALDKILTTLKADGYLFLPLFKESSTVGNVRPKWDGD